MASADNALGKGKCPCCGSKLADVKLSGKGLAYMHCNACNMQLFARSAKSDEHIRDMILTPEKLAAYDDETDNPARAASRNPPAPAPTPAPREVAATPVAKKNPFMLGV